METLLLLADRTVPPRPPAPVRPADRRAGAIPHSSDRSRIKIPGRQTKWCVRRGPAFHGVPKRPVRRPSYRPPRRAPQEYPPGPLFAFRSAGPDASGPFVRLATLLPGDSVMNVADAMKATRRVALAVVLTIVSFAGVSWGQAADGGSGNTGGTRTDARDDDDGFDWGLLGLLGLLGLAGLKRRNDHVRVHDTPRGGL